MSNYGKISEVLAGRQEEIIATLQELIQIESVVGAPEKDMPFGSGVHRALEYVLQKSKEFGFKTYNADNYGGHAEIGQGEETLGILVHLDTVPLGSGWTTDPIGGQLIEDRIYGRGAIDNKGAAAVILHIMKAIKDAEIPLSRKIRIIFGLDEEVGEWEGMQEYLKRAGKPTMAFVPDADFPLIQAEMGILVFELVKKFGKPMGKDLILKSIGGGTAYNMVPNQCVAVVTAADEGEVKEKIKAFKDATGYTIASKGKGRSLEISVSGISSHGARPQQGLNAISIMMQFLGTLEFSCDDINGFISFYNEKIGMELNGASMGCGFSDEISGELIWNTGILQMDESMGKVTINVRYPVSMSGDMVYEGMSKVTDPYNFGIVKIEEKKPVYFSEDHPLVQTLMNVYKEHTGEFDAKPVVIGGGTYARAMDNAVAFGMQFENQKATAHEKDEYIEVPYLMKAMQIYADAILRLTV